MKIDQLVDVMIMMFLLITLGFILTKKKIINTQVKEGITWLVIHIVLPCNIIYSFQQSYDTIILQSMFNIFMISLVIQFGSYVLSKVLYPKYPLEQKAVLQYATICSNAGFIGSPVADGLYGSIGLLYASIYLIPQRIVMWSAGIRCFTLSKGKETWLRIIKHPCIIAVIIGLCSMLFSLPIPSAIQSTIRTIGGCNTTLSMLLIGAILTNVDRKTFVNKTTIYYCCIRLFVIPGMVFIGCWLLQIDPILAGVSLVLSGMPAGATTAILAMQYKGDEVFATACIILSTLLSLFVLPILCYLIVICF